MVKWGLEWRLIIGYNDVIMIIQVTNCDDR